MHSAVPIVIIAVLVLATAIGLAPLLILDEPHTHTHTASTAREVKAVNAHGKWSGELARQIIDAGEPTVIRGTPAEHWSAVSSASPLRLGRLEQLRSKIDNVKVGEERVFLLRSTDRALTVDPLLTDRQHREQSYRLENMTSFEFADLCANPGDMFHYYSGPLRHWPAEVTLSVDVAPFTVDALSTANLWIGQAGVIANTHYDKSDNFFVQLHGQKRWILYPPSEHTALYLFPHLHPAYHQSQVDFNNPQVDLYPLFAPTKAYFEVLLSPGDVLYVPPYWFHRVYALDYSASLSVVSPSQHERIYSELYWLPLPLKAEWDARTRLAVVLHYFSSVFARSSRESPLVACTAGAGDHCADLEAFLRTELARSRWTGYREAAASGPGDAAEMCVRGAEGQELVSALAKEDAEFADTVDGSASRAFELLMRVSPHEAAVMLADVIEETLQWAVGADNVAKLLHTCFA